MTVPAELLAVICGTKIFPCHEDSFIVMNINTCLHDPANGI